MNRINKVLILMTIVLGLGLQANAQEKIVNPTILSLIHI